MDNFFAHYYSMVVFQSNFYFPELSHQVSTLFTKRLGDKILAYWKKRKEGPANAPEPLSSMEVDALQYLAGYVVQNILRKAKNSKSYKEPQQKPSYHYIIYLRS